jgi:vacuolar-type H+-ATPase subunit F/Vma7
MTPFVVGAPEDVVGFALAGIEGVVCKTREEAHQAIANIDADTLVMVSAEFAREIPRDRLAIALPARS